MLLVRMWRMNCPLRKILHAAISRRLSMKVLVNSAYVCVILISGCCVQVYAGVTPSERNMELSNVTYAVVVLFQLWTLFNFQLFCGQSFQLLLFFRNLIHQLMKSKAKSGAGNFLTSTLWGPFLQCEHQVLLPVKLNIMCA